MGTNFYLPLPDGTTAHLGKRSHGWQFTFNAATVFDTEVTTRTQWENLVTMVGQPVHAEHGVEYQPDQFFAEVVDPTQGRHSLADELAVTTDWAWQMLVERGHMFTDPHGWSFQRGEWC